MNDSVIDFLIVTALGEELDSLLSKLTARRLPPSDDCCVYYTSSIVADIGDGERREYNLVLCSVGMAGRVRAASAISAAISKWNPQCVLLVGIAGGIGANGISLGDVIVSDEIVDYELGKNIAGVTDVRYEIYRSDQNLLRLNRNFRSSEWINAITERRPLPGGPKRVIGPILSGDKVWGDGTGLENHLMAWPKLVGVEMEAGGVARVSIEASGRPRFMMVRGISDVPDMHDQKKDLPEVKSWRSYACDVASTYAVGFLKSGLVPSDAWRMTQPANRNTQLLAGDPQPQVIPPVTFSQVTAFRDVCEATEWIRNSIRETTLFEALPYPPVDLLSPGCLAIDAHILPGRFRLALPDHDSRNEIVRSVLEHDLLLTRDSRQYEKRRDYLIRELLEQQHIKPGEARFCQKRDVFPEDSEEKSRGRRFYSAKDSLKRRLSIRCLSSSARLRESREINVRNHLRTHVYFGDEPFNRFNWNGYSFFLSGLRWLMHDNDACQRIILDVLESDYYTYRTIADCSEFVRTDCALGQKMSRGLRVYCDEDFQELIHGGLGILVIVHCRDRRGQDFVIFRRRSKTGANYKDAAKWSSTVNEGLSPYKDKDERTGELKPALDWVRRALERELLGDALADRKILIRACYLTGVLLYLENLTFNLCFLVSLDCDPDVLLRQIPLSPEGSEYNEARVVPFTVPGLNSFLTETVPLKQWDEGALAALGMTLSLIGKIG